MDISANSKEGKASAIEPSISYILRIHGMLAWYDDGTARQDRTVKPQFDNAKQQPPNMGGSILSEMKIMKGKLRIVTNRTPASYSTVLTL